MVQFTPSLSHEIRISNIQKECEHSVTCSTNPTGIAVGLFPKFCIVRYGCTVPGLRDQCTKPNLTRLMHPPIFCSKFNCFYRYKNQFLVGCFFHILPPQPIGLAGSRHCGTKLTSICLSTNTIFPLIIANYPFYRNNTASSSGL